MGVETVLARLDTARPLRSFDAFPKTHSFYTHRTRAGGLWTLLLAALVAVLCIADILRLLWAQQRTHDFILDRSLGSTVDLSLDLTVGMPCPLLSIEWHDAKDDLAHLTALLERSNTSLSATLGHLPQTEHEKKHDTACRISGYFPLARIGGSLNITTAGHGYFDPNHPEAHAKHSQMNLTHVVHHLSFGPSIPGEPAPLDGTRDIPIAPFQVIQYYLRLVPTLYAAPRSQVKTVQYSMTQYSRPLWRRMGTPGIFFDISLEGVTLLLRQSRPPLLFVLVRACMVAMGAWAFGLYLFRLATTPFAWSGTSNTRSSRSLDFHQESRGLRQSISHVSRSVSTRARSLAPALSGVAGRRGHHKSDSLQASIFEEGAL